MKRTRWYCQTAVLLACVGMILPQRLMAAPTASQPLVHDVALGTNGTLTGQVVDGQGIPKTEADVTVWQNENRIAAAKTDENGNFSVAGLRSGVHQVAAGEGVSIYRFWAPNTAPPAASQQALVVSDQNVVRGNGVIGFLTNPWVLAGIVAAAIAIPIALNNDDDDSGS
jgi:hypothetical protein